VNHNPAMFGSYTPVVRWYVPVGTAGVWALAAAAVVFWGLRLTSPDEEPQPPTIAPAQTVSNAPAVAKVLGAVQIAAAPAAESARQFVLRGVIADGAAQGVALIGFDGKPSRPYCVGQAVANGYVLRSVTANSATLDGGQGADAVLTLQLPQRAPGAPRISSGSGSTSAPVPVSASVSGPAPVGDPVLSTQ